MLKKVNIKELVYFPMEKLNQEIQLFHQEHSNIFFLERISKRKNKRAILIFILQRSDCNAFVPNYVKDPTYSDKLYDLINNSAVEVYVLSHKWIKDSLYFHKQLPILNKSTDYNYGKVKVKNLNNCSSFI